MGEARSQRATVGETRAGRRRTIVSYATNEIAHSRFLASSVYIFYCATSSDRFLCIPSQVIPCLGYTNHTTKNAGLRVRAQR